MENIDIILSILGWFATICRAIGMFVKNELSIKIWTSCGNLGWLIVGIVQWIALDMSMTLFVSNAICLGVFIFTIAKSYKRN